MLVKCLNGSSSTNPIHIQCVSVHDAVIHSFSKSAFSSLLSLFHFHLLTLYICRNSYTTVLAKPVTAAAEILSHHFMWEFFFLLITASGISNNMVDFIVENCDTNRKRMKDKIEMKKQWRSTDLMTRTHTRIHTRIHRKYTIFCK